MIAGLRQRHRIVVALGWFALPVILALAWTHRPSTQTFSARAQLDLARTRVEGGPAASSVGVWYEAIDLFEDGMVGASLRATSGPQALTLWAEDLLEPGLLIYWRAEPDGSNDLRQARLLGRWPLSRRVEVLMPGDWTGGGQLVLFSLGHMAIVARSGVLPQELP